MRQLAHFISLAFPLTKVREGEASPLSHYERGIRQDVHFVSSRLSPSLITREGLDGSVTFCSFAALRVAAGGRNLKTRCVRFALAGFVEPSARVLILISFY